MGIPKNGDIVTVKYKFIKDEKKCNCNLCCFNVESEGTCMRPDALVCNDGKTRGHYELVEE